MAGSTRLELATSGVTGGSLSCPSCCNLRRCTAEEKLCWQGVHTSADAAIRLRQLIVGHPTQKEGSTGIRNSGGEIRELEARGALTRCSISRMSRPSTLVTPWPPLVTV